jgi:hypothetical protein
MIFLLVSSSPFRLEAVMGNEKTPCIGAEAVWLEKKNNKNSRTNSFLEECVHKLLAALVTSR